MVSTVTSVIGILAAITIVVLIRRDHLHVRYGLWWIFVAAAFILVGIFPESIDWLAARLGVAYGPTLALTLGLTVFVIKILTVDIARSRNETRIIRLVQRIAMLESEVDDLRRRLNDPAESGEDDTRPAGDQG